MDATLDIEALLVHGPFLKRLARSLLGDDHAADDVVQQTWLTTLMNPPRQAGSLRAFMATVARNLAQEGGRRGSRRKAWEAAAARPEAVPSTEEIVQREAVRRQVVEALLDLDERSRDVLLLRFYENLPPRHIAQQLGLPVETVRTRIKRGLAAMAERLDGEHGGDRKAWSVALLPLAWPQAASAGVGGVLAAGLTSMGPLAQVAVVGLLLAGVALGVNWWLGGEGPPAGDGQAAQPARVASAEPARGGGDALRPGDELVPTGADLQPTATASAAPLVAAAPPLVEGQVLDEAGAPLPGARISLAGIHLDDVELLATANRAELTERWSRQTVVTDDEGRYRIGGLTRGLWILATEAQGARPFNAPGVVLVDVPPLLAVVAMDMVRRRLDGEGMELPAFHALDADGVLALDVIAPAVPTHDVTVVDARGEPVPGARVTALSPAALMAMEASPYTDWTWRRLEPGLETVDGDERGVAPGVAAQPGGLLLVSAPGHRPERVALAADAALPLPLHVTLQPSVTVTITGRVVDARGAPLAGADVGVGDFGVSGVVHERFAQNLAQWESVATVTDAAGRFSFEALDRLSTSTWDPTPVTDGMRFAVQAGSPGTLSAFETVQASREAPHHHVELVLEAGSELEVTVIDRATLRPAEGASVTHSGEHFSSTRTLDADGTTAFGGQLHGDLQLAIRKLGFEPVDRVLEDWRGGPVELLVDFEPVGWRLSVGLTDALGRPVAGSVATRADPDRKAWIVVQAFPADPAALLAEGRSDWRHLDAGAVTGRWRDGRAEFAFDRSWTADEAWIVASCEDDVLVTAYAPRGLDTLDLVARGPWLDGRALPFDLSVVQDGEPISAFGGGAQVLDGATGEPVSRLTWDLFTGDLHGAVPGPGLYDVVIQRLMQADLVLEDVELGSRTEVRVELAAPARLDAVVRGADGLPANAELQLFDAAGRCLYRNLTGTDGALVIRGLDGSEAPYRLVARGADGVDELDLHLAPGQARDLELRLRPCATLRIVAPGLPEGAALLRVLDASGRELRAPGVGSTEHAALTGDGLELSLTAGRHTVELLTPGRAALTRTVDVGPSGTVTVALERD